MRFSAFCALVLLVGAVSGASPVKEPKSDEGCPPAAKVEEPCHDGIRLVTVNYHAKDDSGTCRRKSSMNTVACGHVGCNPARVVEPGNCGADGQLKVLVHHETRDGNGKCQKKETYVHHKCDPNRKADPNADCPEPTSKQGDCNDLGTRKVFKFYWQKDDSNKCRKKVELAEEPCAALEPKPCPIGDNHEKGPCDADGTRTVKRVYFQRDAEGVCKRQETEDKEACSDADKAVSSCGGEKTKENKCRPDGTRLVVREYFSMEDGKCRKKFSSDEKPCHGSGKCPLSRILEPSPCNSKGFVDQLIRHYEKDPKTGKCVAKQTNVPHVCPSKADAAKALKCPDPQFHQHACHEGFRTLYKFYWVPSDSVKGKCRKKVELQREQCAKLVPHSCPKDEVVEKGPCKKSGTRTDLSFTFTYDKAGKCVKSMKSDLVKCDTKKVIAECPAPKVTKGECNKHQIRIEKTLYYERVEGECRRRFKESEEPCVIHLNGGIKCPPPRIVEPGPCNDKDNKVQTLVEHYEPDPKTKKCVKKRSYETKPCPKKKKKLPDCPDPSYQQGECSDGYRTVTKVYYLPTEDDPTCRKKFELKQEPCARLGGVDPKTALPADCPAGATKERGICDKTGHRTDIVVKHIRDKTGKCTKKDVTVLVKCDVKVVCNKPEIKKVGECKNGIQKYTKKYFVSEEDPGEAQKCREKFVMYDKPCNSKKCPDPRVVEPAVCKPGQKVVKTLIQHYEMDKKSGNCKLKHTMKTTFCSKAPKAGECPEPSYHQAACKGSVREVTKFIWVWDAADKKCRRNIELKEESCAKLVPKNCPKGETKETGICDKNNMRSDIIVEYQRDKKGECKKIQKVVEHKCSVKNQGCPAPKIEKKGGCSKLGLQNVIRTYYVHDGGVCRRRFESTDHQCKAITGHKCPIPRIVEPGPCVHGIRSTYVEHYEYEESQGKCVKHKQVKVAHSCKKPINIPGVKNQKCPEAEYHQAGCVGKFRTLTKIYYENDGDGKCRKKFEMQQESCATLVPSKGCPKTSILEDGICTSDGIRTNIEFQYHWDKTGKQCVGKNVMTTEKCGGGKEVCDPPKNIDKPCIKGLKSRVTVFYINNSKGQCVKKFKEEVISCAPKGQCPPPRIVEPGACKNGISSVLVSHYEKKTQKDIDDAAKAGEKDDGKECKEVHTILKHPCGKHAVKKSSDVPVDGENEDVVNPIKNAQDSNPDCPDPTYSQQPCVKGFRKVTKFWYLKGDSGKCRKKMELTSEQCAALGEVVEKNKLATDCPKDELLEEGICKDGMTTVIKYHYMRDKDGTCKKVSVSELKKCSISS